VSDLVPSDKKNRVVSLAALYDSVEPERSSKNSRVAKYKKANLFQVRAMRAAVNKFAEHLGFVDVTEKRKLSKLELEDLMREVNALKETQEIAEARRERIKEMVFTHFDITDGEDQQAEIEIAGKLFKREGGGTKDPTIDPDKLDDELYNLFVTKTVVSNVVVEIDEKAVEEYLHHHPEDIEKVREALIPGQRSSFKFAVRDVVEDGDE
jgi:hypothetical protein